MAKEKDNTRTIHTANVEVDQNTPKAHDEAKAQNPGGAKAKVTAKARHTTQPLRPKLRQKNQHQKRKWLDQNPNRNDSHRLIANT